MTDPRPIGLLDSGVGGLGVLREVRKLLPAEPLVYFADEAHLPYGPRPHAEINRFVAAIATFLIQQNCKMIVIPCNAANAAALHSLRAAHPDLPVVGMEPAIKPAAEATRTGVIGVLTTQATYEGPLFASVVERFARDIRVEAQVCPDWVLLVERGIPATLEAQAAIDYHVRPLQQAGVDQVVLACTHFTFLTPHIRAILRDSADIIDPAPAVARQTGRIVTAQRLSAEPGTAGGVTYFSSGDPGRLQTQIERLLGERRADVRAARWQTDTTLL